MRQPITKVTVPDGISGHWRVESFTVSAAEARFENLRALIGSSARPIEPGDYTRLMYRGSVVMSDTPMEMVDHEQFVYRAKGRVLIGGLGLGMALQAVLAKKDVQHVTVIEKSKDVLALVGPHYAAMGGERLTLVEDDVFTWEIPKGARWDCAWMDVWSDICGDNAADFTKLKRKYGRRVGDLGFWCYYETLRANRRYE